VIKPRQNLKPTSTTSIEAQWRKGEKTKTKAVQPASAEWLIDWLIDWRINWWTESKIRQVNEQQIHVDSITMVTTGTLSLRSIWSRCWRCTAYVVSFTMANKSRLCWLYNWWWPVMQRSWPDDAVSGDGISQNASWQPTRSTKNALETRRTRTYKTVNPLTRSGVRWSHFEVFSAERQTARMLEINKSSANAKRPCDYSVLCLYVR